MTGHVLVIGANGVVGSAAAQHLAGRSEWRLTTMSRRCASLRPNDHVRVDLLDQKAAIAAFAPLSGVTHVVYAAYVDRPSMAETVAPNLTMLGTALAGLEAAGADLARVVLIGGGKSYGEHLGHYKTPARESDPRHLGPIFYNDQEDMLRAAAARGNYQWTVLRPDIVIGHSVGSSMNLLTTIAAYATLCKDAGVPLRFPGSMAAWRALHQITDAGLLAEAIAWALTCDAAANETFNVTNGDLFRWEHVWPGIAAVFDLPTAEPQPLCLQAQMADKADTWDRLIREHALPPTSLKDLASWGFADAVWNSGFDLVQSTIKIRQAGFAGCRDSEAALVEQLRSLRSSGVVP